MKVAPQSLMGRIAIAFAAIAVVVTSVGAVMVLRQVRHAVQVMHELSLLAVLDPIAERLRLEGPASLQALPAPLAARLDSAGGTVSYAVTDASGHVVSASTRAGAWLPYLNVIEDGLDDTFRIEDATHRFWGRSRFVETPQGRMMVQVGQDMTSPFVVLDDIPGITVVPIVTLLAGGAMILLIANLGLTRMLLRPLHRAAAEAEAIRPGSSRRIGDEGMPVEVLPLIRAVNGALDRLDEAFGRQRRFSHDVAHELRTPLAILTTELDLMPDAPATLRLRRDVEHLAELVDQLLEDAESPPASPETEADLVLVCRDVVERLAVTAGRDGQAIAMTAGNAPIWVRGDEGELRRAVRNLADNALRHTARGTRVEVRAIAPATIEVADRGPGVPEAQRGLIFERFWRADRAQRDGSGIGLALVSEIAARHGGAVTVRDNPGGGAIFALTLQPARAG